MNKIKKHYTQLLIVIFSFLTLTQGLSLIEGVIIVNTPNSVYIEALDNDNTEFKEGDLLKSINDIEVKTAVQAFIELQDKKGKELTFIIERDQNIKKVIVNIPQDYPETKLGIQFDNTNKNLKYRGFYTNTFFAWAVTKILLYFLTIILLIKKRKIGEIVSIAYLLLITGFITYKFIL